MTSPLALSPTATAHLSFFGTEKQPLLVIDDCLADADAVVAIAARHEFARHGPFYPGVRAPVSARVAMPLVAPLLGQFQDIFSLAGPPTYHECYLSAVTTPGADLRPIQRLPHFDGVEAERIAVLLYLDRVERGGTAFYRQHSTGFESVDASRYGRYSAALAAETAEHGLPDAGYIGGDTAIFAQVHRVAGRFNRMIAYRGNTLHCADLPRDFVPAADPAAGRLTLNLFLA